MNIDKILRFIFIWALLVAVFMGCLVVVGCRSTKEVSKTEYIYDSTAINEVERLTQTLIEERQQHEKELYELSTTGIYFNTVYLPGDTIYKPGTVTIDKNGTIKAEGRLSSVLLSNERFSKENILLHKKVDSLVAETKKNKVQVIEKETIKEKKVKRDLPVWLFIVCVLIGLIAENKIKIIAQIKRLISLIKFKP